MAANQKALTGTNCIIYKTTPAPETLYADYITIQASSNTCAQGPSSNLLTYNTYCGYNLNTEKDAVTSIPICGKVSKAEHFL